MQNALPQTKTENIKAHDQDARNPAQFLIKMQDLPPDKQAEVFDFIEFLVSRNPSQIRPKTSLAKWLLMIPNVGLDEDFIRIDQAGEVKDVFN